MFAVTSKRKLTASNYRAVLLVTLLTFPGIAWSGTSWRTTSLPPYAKTSNQAVSIDANGLIRDHFTGGYSLKVPASWQMQRADQGVRFSSADGFQVLIHDFRSTRGPNVKRIRKGYLPQLRSDLPIDRISLVQRITLPSGPSILIEFQTRDPDTGAIRKHHQILYFNGHVVVVVDISAPPANQNPDPWSLIPASFSWDPAG